MPEERLTLREIEELGYYDFMGYLGVPFFNVGGISSIDRLVELCGIGEGSEVLDVGCGTGGNACHIARSSGCRVVGVDIAEHMVEEAQRRAEAEGLAGRVRFMVGDAYELDFQDGSFDAVVTVFASQFLDPVRAFPEFFRVLRPGGRLGINEMSVADEAPQEIARRVEEGETLFRELTGLPFSIRADGEWRTHFESAGFADILAEAYTETKGMSYAWRTVAEYGGLTKFMGILSEMIALAAKSGRIRKKLSDIDRAKRILLRDKAVSEYVGYMLCVGSKPATPE